MRRSPLRRCGPPWSACAARPARRDARARARTRAPGARARARAPARALASVEPRLFEVARALCLSLAAQIFKIIIPAALPRIFLALRFASVALIVAVTVEISANTIGLGHMMMQAGQSLHPDIMLAFLVWVGVLGWGMNALMMAAQRHLFGAMLGESTG